VDWFVSLHTSFTFYSIFIQVSLFKFRHSFIFQVTSTRRQRSQAALRSSSQAATCYYQSNHSKLEAIPLNACPRTQQANLPAYLHTISWVAFHSLINYTCSKIYLTENVFSLTSTPILTLKDNNVSGLTKWRYFLNKYDR